MHRIVIAGTSTAVGKTWVACRLTEQLLEQSFRISVKKPVQSFLPESDVRDSDLLSAASHEPSELVCPVYWSYPLALAPPIAAGQLGRSAPSLKELGEFALSGASEIDFRLIELVGGFRSPIAVDGDSIDLARLLEPDLIILVSSSELGAINDVRLALEICEQVHVATYLNHFDRNNVLHRTNAAFLENAGVTIITSIDTLTKHVLDQFV